MSSVVSVKWKGDHRRPARTCSFSCGARSMTGCRRNRSRGVPGPAPPAPMPRIPPSRWRTSRWRSAPNGVFCACCGTTGAILFRACPPGLNSRAAPAGCLARWRERARDGAWAGTQPARGRPRGDAVLGTPAGLPVADPRAHGASDSADAADPRVRPPPAQPVRAAVHLAPRALPSARTRSQDGLELSNACGEQADGADLAYAVARARPLRRPIDPRHAPLRAGTGG